jgi:HD-like signal output (HDOD) protein
MISNTIHNIIAKDPALTATLLRMANSARFGLSRTVTTLDAAVNVVGMSQIRARALGICVSQVLTMPHPAEEERRAGPAHPESH